MIDTTKREYHSKLNDEYENWFADQYDILQVITFEFLWEVKKDSWSAMIPLFRSISNGDNLMLTKEVAVEEIHQTIN